MANMNQQTIFDKLADVVNASRGQDVLLPDDADYKEFGLEHYIGREMTTSQRRHAAIVVSFVRQVQADLAFDIQGKKLDRNLIKSLVDHVEYLMCVGDQVQADVAAGRKHPEALEVAKRAIQRSTIMQEKLHEVTMVSFYRRRGLG